MTTMECPSCHLDIPGGRFCGLCGQPLANPAAAGLRPATFGACPDEGVLRPALASALFPHLPRRSRLPFRLGLLAVGLGLVGLAALRFSPALVTLVSVGPTLLFLLYLRASQVDRGLGRGPVALAVVLGAGFAVGWTLLTHRAEGWTVLTGVFRGWSTSGDYGLPLAVDGDGLVGGAVAASVTGALMMSMPALVVGLLPKRTREALDGFAVGVAGALAFAAAASLIRLAPQFTTGLRQHTRPFSSFAVEAGINGVVIPLCAAAAGGVIGVALWFRPRHDDRFPARLVLWLLFVAVLVTYVGIGRVDSLRLPQAVVLLFNLLLAVACLLALRVAIQVGLLYEQADPATWEPLLCEHCERVVPDAAFCASCGAAARASSRESRQVRRRMRPVAVVSGDS